MSYYPKEKYFDPTSGELVGKYTDSNGFDGGDTAQRTGMYYSGAFYGNESRPYFKGHAMSAMALLEECGNYVRYPFTTGWEADGDRLSRDQMTPVICTLGVYNLNLFLKRMLKAHLKRGLLFTTNTRRNGTTKENHGSKYKPNAPELTRFQQFVLKYKIPFFSVPKGYRNYNWKLPDLTFFSIWAMYIRGFRSKMLSPLLPLLDLEFLINSIMKRTLVKEDSDIVNHVVEAVYFQKNMPTFIVKFANKYINDPEDMQKRMDIYFSDQDEPSFINELYKPLIKEVMG